VSIGDRIFVEDIGAFVLAVLLDEAVAGVLQLLGTLIYRRGRNSSNLNATV